MNKKIPFREHHLLDLLEAYDQQELPLDLFINHYFRENKSLGSKDRAFISETVYTMIRWRALLDHFTKQPADWEDRYKTYTSLDLHQAQQQEDIPPHIRVSFPQVLFRLIEANYGTEKALEICRVSNTQAPTVIRANTLKIKRDALLARWKEQFAVSPTRSSPDGIIFHKRLNFSELPEFKEGLFEVQDEGSQLLAYLVKPNPSDLVLDYCAGSGGKTLAFAKYMEHKGQIYVHDIRPHILQDAKKRLKKAGIQNAQVILPESANLNKLKKKMNWILVDAPCSGTGTMRRNPDMKWKFNETMLTQLVGQQRTIFEKALSFMHPEGRIVYGTCSILKEENQEQVEHFLKTYNLAIEGEILQTLPTLGGMDGFFGVVLKKI